MRRLIVTGPNGAGKSHFAARLGAISPDVPVISFDAMKITRNWKLRPRPEIDAELQRVIATDRWILEGGPSLLTVALARADSVMWLDPPLLQRAWRLAIRPLRNIGKTRPELPPGNPDWLLGQYLFAFQSLRSNARFQDRIANLLASKSSVRIWRIQTSAQLESALRDWQSETSTPFLRVVS